MSQEWDEVKHEVDLVIGRLDRLHGDLKAARDSGALTGPQMKVVERMMWEAFGTMSRLDDWLVDATKDETAEEGETR